MKKVVKTIAFLSLITVAVACKNDTKKTETTPAAEQTAAPENNVFKVELGSNDQMQYSKNEIKVPVGETIELTLKHTGKMPKEVMGHNFVLLNKGVDFSDFAAKAALASETNYIPTDGESAIIAHTEMIGGGESATVEFTITEAGSYDFLCSFPGHSAMMKGVLIAE